MNNQNFVGLGAVFTTIIMASGRWDIFDWLVTGGLLYYAIYFQKPTRSSLGKDIFIASCMGLITLAFVLASLSLAGLYLGICEFAKFDFETFHLCECLYGSQSTDTDQISSVFKTQLLYKSLIFSGATLFYLAFLRFKGEKLHGK